MVTPRSGFDLEYYLDRVGEKKAGGYYLNAAQQGEPPGRWFGKGAEALGFTDGQTVERDPYLAAYQQTDPRTGDKLGRGPNGYPRFRQIFARKMEAEPHATFERRLELEREARQEARRSPVHARSTAPTSASASTPRSLAASSRCRRRAAPRRAAPRPLYPRTAADVPRRARPLHQFAGSSCTTGSSVPTVWCCGSVSSAQPATLAKRKINVSTTATIMLITKAVSAM